MASDEERETLVGLGNGQQTVGTPIVGAQGADGVGNTIVPERTGAPSALEDQHPRHQNGNLSHLSLIPDFSGKPGGIKVQHYFGRIDEVGLMSNWSELQMAVIARLKLSGDAREVVVSDADMMQASYATLKQQLTERFKVDESRNDLLTKFNQCVQKPGESVRSYGTRLYVAGNRTLVAAHNEPEKALRKGLLEEAMLDQFVRGIHGTVRRFVLSANPTSYQQAYERAIREESIELAMGASLEALTIRAVGTPKATRNAQEPPTPTGSQSGPRTNLHEPPRDEQASRRIEQGRTGDARVSTCFRCGGRGHSENVCPSPSEDRPRRNTGAPAQHAQTEWSQGRSPRPECSYCNRVGHTREQCWLLNPSNRPRSGNARRQGDSRPSYYQGNDRDRSGDGRRDTYSSNQGNGGSYSR